MSSHYTFYIVLFSILLLEIFGNVTITKRQDSLGPGDKARVHQNWKFICTVAFGQYAVCGGAVIGKQWVITGAFCVDESNRHKNSRRWYGTLGVRIGSDDQQYVKLSTIVNSLFRGKIKQEAQVSSIPEGSMIPVQKTVLYPEYSRTVKTEKARKLILENNGVALLRLESEVSPNIPVIPLAKNLVSNTNCRTASWGTSSLTSEDFNLEGPHQLEEIDWKIMDKEQCKEHLATILGEFEIPEDEKEKFLIGKRCAFSDHNAVRCGDGGGPVVCDGKLRGIIYGTNNEDKSALFYDTAEYSDWIERSIKEPWSGRTCGPSDNARSHSNPDPKQIQNTILNSLITFSIFVFNYII